MLGLGEDREVTHKSEALCCFLIVRCKTQVPVGKERLGALGNLGEITSHYFPIHKMENKIYLILYFKINS